MEVWKWRIERRANERLTSLGINGFPFSFHFFFLSVWDIKKNRGAGQNKINKKSVLLGRVVILVFLLHMMKDVK